MLCIIRPSEIDSGRSYFYDSKELRLTLELDGLTYEVDIAWTDDKAAEEKLDQFNNFDLSQTFDYSHFTVTDNWDDRFSDELIQFSADALITGFEEETDLKAVATYVIDKLGDREGGNWLCIIGPIGIDNALSFYYRSKSLKLSFELDGLTYIINIAYTGFC